MKTKLSWLCAVAMGMSALPATMANAAPDSAAATPAPTVPVVAQATDPVITAAPGQTEKVVPNQPVEGNTLPAAQAGAQIVGQVMPGVQGANAPVAVENAPSRDVKLSFAQIAPPPGSMVLRGVNPNGGVEFGMRSDEVVSQAVLNLEYTPSPSLLPVQSQLKVYLNDELMDVLPVTKEQLGKKRWRRCRSTRCLSPTLTAFALSSWATTATSAKTRPAARCGWTWGATRRCR
jgi:Bacterial cellulose synthase subunit.